LRAYIVVDLGFGDAGKGLLTDFLARRLDAGLVVRYNGGAQAGHNVVAPDGRHHTFAQFGSGTLIPGVRTYLSRHMVVHPGALLVEGDLLVSQGVHDAFSRLRISDQARVITPFHQAANRIRELARGAHRHGSCGAGVGEAVEDARLHPSDCLLAGDLAQPAVRRRKLHAIRARERAQIAPLCQGLSLSSPLAREWAIFEGEEVIDAWTASICRITDLGLVASDSRLQRWLHAAETVIFEGAQGVLLDADAGFHPFTTWSNATAANALDLIAEWAPGSPAFKIGVLRSYAVRHGPGPLPTETDAFAASVHEHNQSNDWQGAVRYGWFDAVLARYALAVTGGVDALTVTHLDLLSHLKTWQYCPAHTGWRGFDDPSVETNSAAGALTDFRLPPSLPLAQRAAFTQALSALTPRLESCAPDEATVLQKIASLLGQPVNIVSRGLTAEHVQILNPIPLSHFAV
jgi:adenylosuccinate synthase